MASILKQLLVPRGKNKTDSRVPSSLEQKQDSCPKETSDMDRNDVDALPGPPHSPSPEAEYDKLLVRRRRRRTVNPYVHRSLKYFLMTWWTVGQWVGQVWRLCEVKSEVKLLCLFIKVCAWCSPHRMWTHFHCPMDSSVYWLCHQSAVRVRGRGPCRTSNSSVATSLIER